MKKKHKLMLVQSVFLYLLLQTNFAANFWDIKGQYMTGTRSVPENFAIAMTDTNWVIGVFSNPRQRDHTTQLDSGTILEYQSEYWSILNMMYPWEMDEIIKGSSQNSYYIREVLLRIEGVPTRSLITSSNGRWIFILKQIPLEESGEDINTFSEVKMHVLSNAYYNLNFDATGSVCLLWPEDSDISPRDHIVFSTDEAADDLKAIAAVYTPENGGENIPAGDIATLENALETDFGRSVLTELLQLHGDPREE